MSSAGLSWSRRDPAAPHASYCQGTFRPVDSRILKAHRLALCPKEDRKERGSNPSGMEPHSAQGTRKEGHEAGARRLCLTECNSLATGRACEGQHSTARHGSDRRAASAAALTVHARRATLQVLRQRAAQAAILHALRVGDVVQQRLLGHLHGAQGREQQCRRKPFVEESPLSKNGLSVFRKRKGKSPGPNFDKIRKEQSHFVEEKPFVKENPFVEGSPLAKATTLLQKLVWPTARNAAACIGEGKEGEAGVGLRKLWTFPGA